MSDSNKQASVEQLQAQLAAATSENEALAHRLAVRMEELLQAVQARLAAEKERGQLLVALEPFAKAHKEALRTHRFDTTIGALTVREFTAAAQAYDGATAQKGGAA